MNIFINYNHIYNYHNFIICYIYISLSITILFFSNEFKLLVINWKFYCIYRQRYSLWAFFHKILAKNYRSNIKKKRHNRRQFSDETLVRKIYWYTLKSRTQIFIHYKTSLTELYLSVSKCLLNCFTLRNVFNRFKNNIK